MSNQPTTTRTGRVVRRPLQGERQQTEYWDIRHAIQSGADLTSASDSSLVAWIDACADELDRRNRQQQ